MARGGKRPGAGRKKGAVGVPTKKRISLAQRLNEDGVSPLEIMTTTMQDLWREANAGERPNIGKRMQAVMLAEKVAPYLHPKLSSVTAQVSGSMNVTRNPKDMTDDELLVAAAGGGAGVIDPKAVTH